MVRKSVWEHPGEKLGSDLRNSLPTSAESTPAMTPEAWISAAIVLAVIAALATNKISADVAMVGGLVSLMLLQIIPPSAALRGFAHPAVFVIGSLFVVAAGLTETGAMQAVAQRWLGRPKTVAQAQLRMMGPVALMSAFMNNTPIVAMYLPIINDWSRKIRVSPSKLFMPLSFAAILGGKITVIGSASNLVVMGLYLQYLEENQSWLASHGFGHLSNFKQFWGPAALGIPATLAGLAFVVGFSRWLLPERKPANAVVLDARRYTVQMEVLPDSPIVGKSIEEAGLRHLPGLYLTEIERAGEQIPAPSPEVHIRAGDRLAFAGILESVVDVRKIRGLVPSTDQVQKINTTELDRTLVEAVVSHNSPLVRRSVRESRFRTVYNAAIIAVHRNGERIKAKVGDIVLRPGDTLLLETHGGFVDAYRNSDDFYLVSKVRGSTPIRHDKAWISLAILGCLVGLFAFSSIPPVVVAMCCALAMVGFGCVTHAVARASINSQVLVVIACALGISEALQRTGAAQSTATHLLDWCDRLGLGPGAMLFVVVLLASLFGQVVTNNGAAALMFPITMATARQLGVSPEPFMFTLMVGAGLSFMTPISYQTNLMVYGPGGYRFGDFARFGIPLTVVTALVATLACLAVYPFRP